MAKYFVFFLHDFLPKANVPASVLIINCANAAANLGYPAVMVYFRKGLEVFNPISWIYPFHPRKPHKDLIGFYSIQEKLREVALPMPLAVDRCFLGRISPALLTSRYYFPIHILPHTKLLCTRHWEFVKIAVNLGVPVIFEYDHWIEKQFEPEIVNNPLLKVAVTVAEPLRKNMIEYGMPAEKIIKSHNGINKAFLIRYPDGAAQWRRQLLSQKYKYLAVYAGALVRWKGIDMLVDVARVLPQVEFVLAGGEPPQIDYYQKLASEKSADNVKFLGYVPHDKLISLYQAADVLVYPHLFSEASTFTSPMKFFEYLASGSPIVATEIGPLMEFKSSNLAIGWCEKDNPNAFAKTIERVLTDYPRRDDGYSENIEFSKQFSWENRIIKVLSRVDESLRLSLLEE